jgi:ketosteroid isomerase-like protein
MHPNAELITRFYTSLSQLDGAGMAACYANEATFSDPVFTNLSGQEPGKMWRMLCKRGKDMTVVFDGIEATDTAGKAHWVATYTFSGTGNQVINDIQASFVFKDGKIVQHKDVFDLYKWARQALGLKGLLLGWTPFVQGAIRKTAAAGLAAFKG